MAAPSISLPPPTAPCAGTWKAATGKLTRSGDTWTSTLGWTDRADGHRVALGACDSGEITFELDAKGERVSLGLPWSYFGLVRDFIASGTIATAYPGAVVVR